MMNFNLTGVNAQTKYPAEAMLLAEWMTNSDTALEMRYEISPAASTNKKMEETIAADTENEALKSSYRTGTVICLTDIYSSGC